MVCHLLASCSCESWSTSPFYSLLPFDVGLVSVLSFLFCSSLFFFFKNFLIVHNLSPCPLAKVLPLVSPTQNFHAESLFVCVKSSEAVPHSEGKNNLCIMVLQTENFMQCCPQNLLFNGQAYIVYHVTFSVENEWA